MPRVIALLTALFLGAALSACQYTSSEGVYGRAAVPRPPHMEEPAEARPPVRQPVQEQGMR